MIDKKSGVLLLPLLVACASAPEPRSAQVDQAGSPYQNVSLGQKFEGAVIGALIGDALGKGVEGFGMREESSQLIPEPYLDGCIVKMAVRDVSEQFPDALPPPPGTYTDDSEEMAATLISLNRNQGDVNQEDMIRQLGQMFIMEHGYSARTGKLLKTLAALPDPASWKSVTLDEKLGRLAYESNGCAMRISPVGLAALRKTDQELRRMVSLACEITHPAPVSTEGAIAVAKAIQLALSTKPSASKFDHQAFMDRLLKTIRLTPNPDDPAVAEFIKRLERVKSFLVEIEKMAPVQAARAETERLRDSAFLGVGFKINNAIPGAIYLAARYMNNFEQGMNRAVMISLAGDTDTIPAMSGAIIGAHLGIESVPQAWIAQLMEKNDNGTPTKDWLEQWSTIWRDQRGLTEATVPKHFDLRFLPLHQFRKEAKKLFEFVNR